MRFDTEKKNKKLEAALWYRNKMQFSVIPIRTDEKSPRVKAEEFQRKRLPTVEEIKTWWNKWPDSNIGICTGIISKISVVDKDNHKMSTEERQEIAKILFPVDTPTVISPRGGEHLYFKYSAELPHKSDILKNVDGRNNGGYIIAPPSSYNGQEYRWVKTVSKIPLAKIPDEYILSFKRYLSSTLGTYIGGDKPQSGPKLQEATRIKEGRRDQELFHIANHLVKGKMPEEEVQYYLTLIARYACERGKKPYTEKEVIEKVGSVIKRAENQDLNVANMVREWATATGGYFLATKCHTELQLATREQKRAANAELQRLAKTGILERHGDIRGQYRLIETEFNFEDFKAASAESFPIELPMDLSSYVETMPGDLILFAGSPNVGKSCILFDIIRQNMKRHKIYYFSSELNKYAINKRLKMDMHIDIKDWNFKFSSDFVNIVDCVQPDGITILDYIEEEEGKYYKIPSLMAQIHAKLKTGVCVAALQKSSTKTWGVGGEMTLAKPNLYCTLDAEHPGTRMTIRKCKNWASDENPNGFFRVFKIVRGIQILSQGLWMPELEK